MKNVDASPPATYYDDTITGDVIGAYLQDEVRLGQRLILTAGTRFDHDSHDEAVVSPRADLVWTVSRGTRLKLLGGSAFRAPSPYENLSLTGARSAARLKPERVATVEGTLEHSAGPFTAALTAYRSTLRDLIDLVTVDLDGNTLYENRARVRSQGLEGGLRFTPDATTHARVELAWQHSEDGDTGAELTNSPRWNAHVLAYHVLPGGRTTVGTGARYLSSRLTLAGQHTAAAVVCDARVSQRLVAGLTAGFEVRDLFDTRYGDPGSREHTQDQIVQDARTFFFTLSFLSSEPR